MNKSFSLIIISALIILRCSGESPVSAQQPLEILYTEAYPDTVHPRGNSQLICVTNVPQDTSISYYWSAELGTFSSQLSSDVIWTAPDIIGTYGIEIVVSNEIVSLADSLFITVIDYIHPDGYLTYSFDDGMRSVYDNALPVLESFQQVGSANVYTRTLLTGYEIHMDIEQLLDLQSRGWQINSHSSTHPKFSQIPQRYEDEILSGWEQVESLENVYRCEYTYEQLPFILKNDSLLIESESLDSIVNIPDSYYFSDEEDHIYIYLAGGSSPGNYTIRSDSVERELEQSKIELESMGLSINSFVVPHNDWNQERAELASNYYTTVSAGYGPGQIYFNTLPLENPFWLYRKSVYSDTSVGEVIDCINQYILEEGGYLILAFHGIGSDSGYEPWPQENLQQIAQYVNDLHIRVIPQMIPPAEDNDK